MISIPKVVGVMSSGFLGLSHAAQADNDNAAASADEMNADQSDRRQGSQDAGKKQMRDEMKRGHLKGGKTTKGELLRVAGDNYFVKSQDGKEVRLHTDHTTQKTGTISQGDRIEANVNDQNYTLSIRGTAASH
jgi:hypothetical protein